MTERPAEAVIEEALVTPGHDGRAVLLVRLRHGDGALDSVTLEPEAARKLLEDCGADTLDALRGQPWQRLRGVLQP